MARRDDVEVIGLKELERNARLLEDAIEDELPDAVDAGAEVVEEGARKRAPRETGKGAEEITREFRKKGKTEAAVAIGPGSEGFWLLFQEVGTEHHPPQPWLRPALDNKRKEAAAKFARKMRVRIRKELASR